MFQSKTLDLQQLILNFIEITNKYIFEGEKIFGVMINSMEIGL